MLKISRLSFSRGLIKKSGVSYGLFKPAKTEEEQHRQARDYPWWRNGAIAVGLIVFVNVCSLAFYNGNRWYQSWRPSGNDIYINSSIDKLLFSRPDLAVVSVKCLLHHALTGTTTPFADPIAAPPGYKQEVDELVAFVEELHHNQPLYSIPDLWAMITCKALSRLGGPIITPYRGREATSGTTVVFKESLVQENKRDVLNMKRVLVKQGYSLDQLVAIMGCLRSIGFHDSANFHTKEEIKPSFRNTGVVGPKAGDFVIPDTTEKTTLDPYVFGSDYFDLLLDYNWKKGIFSNSSVFRCSAKDKRRDIVLLDPFSARTAESIGELEKAKEKAQNDSDSFYQKKNAVMSGENPEQLGKYGRTGEAQFIPGPKANEIVELSNDFMDEEEGVSVDPCEHVSMKGIDVMLLDDGLTTGWLHKFSSSELEFYAAVTEVVLDIQNRGHNVNNLYLPRK